MDMPNLAASREFNPAEIGAIAHLYRGEIYRSTVWRTRLDNTTNWSVAGLGVALSISFSRSEASALPILLIGLLIVVFLLLESRRYRYTGQNMVSGASAWGEQERLRGRDHPSFQRIAFFSCCRGVACD